MRAVPEIRSTGLRVLEDYRSRLADAGNTLVLAGVTMLWGARVCGNDKATPLAAWNLVREKDRRSDAVLYLLVMIPLLLRLLRWK